MTQGKVDRLLWVWLAAPFAILAVFALGLWLLYAHDQHVTPRPFHRGPFHLSAWLLPAQYQDPQLIQLVDGEGVGLAAGEARAGGYYYGLGPSTVLRLTPGAQGGLAVSATHSIASQGEQPMMLTGDGRLLYMPRGTYLPPGQKGQPAGMQAELTPLPDGANQKVDKFDLGFYSTYTYWFTMLDDHRVGMIDDRSGMGGKARPWVTHAGQPPAGGTELTGVLACGDVWQGWPSLGMLVAPDKLYVLDRTTEQFALRPDLAVLAAAAISGTPRIKRFALSGDCIATQAMANDALRLFSRDGSSLILPLYNPETHNPDGTPRVIPPGGPLTWLPLYGLNRYDAAARALRREGRQAPLSSIANAGGDCQILPIGTNRFAVLDAQYDRVVVIEDREQR